MTFHSFFSALNLNFDLKSVCGFWYMCWEKEWSELINYSAAEQFKNVKCFSTARGWRNAIKTAPCKKMWNTNGNCAIVWTRKKYRVISAWVTFLVLSYEFVAFFFQIQSNNRICWQKNGISSADSFRLRMFKFGWLLSSFLCFPCQFGLVHLQTIF